MDISKIDYVPFKCSKCGREIPKDRECPTCAVSSPWWSIIAAFFVVGFGIGGIVAWTVRDRKPFTLEVGDVGKPIDVTAGDPIIAEPGSIMAPRYYSWLDMHPRPIGNCWIGLTYGEPIWKCSDTSVEKIVRDLRPKIWTITTGDAPFEPAYNIPSSAHFDDFQPVIVIRGGKCETVMVPKGDDRL